MFCQRQTMQHHMERGVRQIEKQARKNGMLKHDSGAGSREQLGMMSNGRDASKGLTKRGNKSKAKRDTRNIQIRSNKSESSSLHIQQLADPNKGRMNGVLSSMCVALVDS